MCVIRVIELTVAWQNSKQYHAKCMRFSKMQLVPQCYTALLYEPISTLYILIKNQPYIFPMLGLRFFYVCVCVCVYYFFFFVFFFTGIEKPDY